jgi:hypothetical protein
MFKPSALMCAVAFRYPPCWHPRARSVDGQTGSGNIKSEQTTSTTQKRGPNLTGCGKTQPEVLGK